MTGEALKPTEGWRLQYTPKPDEWHYSHNMSAILCPSAKCGERIILDMRGWGYLTGKGHGALGLDSETAAKEQDALALFIIDACKAAAFPPAPAEVEPVATTLRLTIARKIGMYGAAYDGPQDARAYTYKHQPSDQPAWKMGRAMRAAAKEPCGDYIDGGLALLRHLEAEGYGVFALVQDEPIEATPLDAATIRAEARREALEEAAAWHDDQAALHDAQGEACGTDSDGWKRHTVAAADHRRSAASVRALADKGEAE